MDKIADEIARLKEENRILREHIADIHNSVRHTLAREIEEAVDRAFKAMSGIKALQAARAANPPATRRDA